MIEAAREGPSRLRKRVSALPAKRDTKKRARSPLLGKPANCAETFAGKAPPDPLRGKDFAICLLSGHLLDGFVIRDNDV
jgi:hypothetical protein